MKIPDFKLKAKNPEDLISNQANLQNILIFAVDNTFSKELNGQMGAQRVSTLNGGQGRMWGRIQRKLDEAEEKNSMDLSFETAEIDFMKKAISEATFPINWFKWTVQIEDMLDSKEESDDSKNSKGSKTGKE